MNRIICLYASYGTSLQEKQQTVRGRLGVDGSADRNSYSVIHNHVQNGLCHHNNDLEQHAQRHYHHTICTIACSQPSDLIVFIQ